MSKIIRDISKDIKCKIKDADRDIRKAIERKETYPNLSNNYYEFSITKLDEIMALHDNVVDLIQEYSKDSEPPKTMLDMWEWEHQQIMEDISEIKLLQDFYKNL